MVGGRGLSSTDFSFQRYLSEPFLTTLEKLVDKPEEYWWRDVLAHRDLFLAIRRNSLAAYYRGARIFNVLVNGDATPETHFKYLLRQRQGHVKLEPDGFFKPGPALFMWAHYEKQTTLKEMLQAANAYAGVEKTGLHALIMASDNVIDVEVSFSRRELDTDEFNGVGAADEAEAAIDDFLGESSDASSTKANRRLDRIDAVSLEGRDGALSLVFHEAKHFSNKDLRASGARLPSVVEQIDRYRQIIKQYESNILKSYADVCRALVRIEKMKSRLTDKAKSPAARAGKELVAQAAAGATLNIDPDPRLIIYGFDQAQRDDDRWREHYARLLKSLGPDKVYAIGDPRKAGPAAFSPRGGR
jgi:hypothetical protein